MQREPHKGQQHKDQGRDAGREPGRELRGDLFGRPTSGSSTAMDPYQKAFGAGPRVESSIVTIENSMALEPRPSPVQRLPSLEDTIAVEAEFHSMRITQQQSERRVEHLAHQLGEIVKVMQARFERLSANTKASDDIHERREHELADMIAHLKMKVTEHLGIESKIHEMVERHNTVVRNFENRLSSMQRVMAQQEMTLHNAMAMINELRLQIERGPKP